MQHVFVYRLVLLFTILLISPVQLMADDSYQQQRDQLMTLIEADVSNNSDFLDSNRLAEQVITAMRTVPRHEFVPQKNRHQAYKNRPLPIGYGQTISQPTIVAIMTDLLQLKNTDRVLEVGTGSGYQAAVLAEITESVYTIEVVTELADRAAKDLKRTGYNEIKTRTGDGYYGWQEAAPFDAIIVTAAASHIPPPLVKQLKVGGRMIIPVGSQFMVQHLVLVTKDAADKVKIRQILPVKFVPLTGKH